MSPLRGRRGQRRADRGRSYPYVMALRRKRRQPEQDQAGPLGRTGDESQDRLSSDRGATRRDVLKAAVVGATIVPAWHASGALAEAAAPSFVRAGHFGPEVLRDEQGARMAGSSVTVLLPHTSIAAVLYASRDKTRTAANPFTTDEAGSYAFFAEPGQYDVEAGGRRFRVTVPIDPEEASQDQDLNAHNDDLSAHGGVHSSGEVNILAHGAVGDGAADDGPALQRALEALASRGGGVLVLPPGRYVIETPVVRDFLGAASNIVLRGRGSASQLVLATGAGSTCINLMNLNVLRFESITFVGRPGVYPDVSIGVRLSYCQNAVFEGCELYGIGATGAGGGIIVTDTSFLSLLNTNFYGCSGDSGGEVSVVEVERYGGLYVDTVRFWDAGNLNGTIHSKTNVGIPYAWIRTRNPLGDDNSDSQRQIYLNNVSMDEAAYIGLLIFHTGNVPPRYVEVNNLGVNGISTIPGGYGAIVRGARRMVISRSWFGFSKTPAVALRLRDCGNVEMHGVLCVDKMDTIEAVATESLSLVDCVYGTLNSSAKVTNIMSGGDHITPLLATGGVATKVTSGPPSEASFVTPPPDGTLVADSANQRLYVRMGGTWRFVGLS